MDGRHRVAVTGVGVVASCGVGRKAFWDGLFVEPPNGRELPIHDFDPRQWYDKRELRRVDRFAQLARAAALEAWEDGGEPEPDPPLGGVMIGTGFGGYLTLEEQMRISMTEGEEYTNRFAIPMVMPNAAAAEVSIKLGWQGPCEAITTACATGTHNIAAGARLIEDGRCDVVLAGSTEGAMARTAVYGFARLTALSTSGVSRPFDARRDGFVFSEGSGVLLLERLDHAKARGAHIYALLLGSGSTADGLHITAPNPDGASAAECMRRALAAAGVSPEQVSHVNAHGTSTTNNDEAEARAIRSVFGSHRVPVTSTKGAHGHALGAAGSVEAVGCVLSLEHGIIPPTLGYGEPDPDLDIDVVAEPTPFEPGPILSNSFAFGGHNAALVFAPADWGREGGGA